MAGDDAAAGPGSLFQGYIFDLDGTVYLGDELLPGAARLLARPHVVILDEATAHLDSTSEAAVQAALGVALEGRTALVIAHRLSTIRQADTILVIEDGRVVEQGTHSELLATSGRYSELYRTQFQDDAEPAPAV